MTINENEFNKNQTTLLFVDLYQARAKCGDHIGALNATVTFGRSHLVVKNLTGNVRVISVPTTVSQQLTPMHYFHRLR